MASAGGPRGRGGPFPHLLLPLLLAALIDMAIVARSPTIARDGITFIELSRSLTVDVLQALRSADQHPGYPVMILWGRWLASAGAGNDPESWIAAARVAPALCGLLVVPLVFLLARSTFNTRAGAVAAWLCAALPSFRQNAADALSDTPHLLFYLGAAWLALEGLKRRRWIWFAGAGLAGGAAYWVRPEGLGVLAGTALALVLSAVWRSGMPRKTALLCLLALVMSALLATAPYVIASGKITGKKNLSKLALDTECRRLVSEHPLQVLGQGLLELVKETGNACFVLLLVPLAVGLYASRGLRGGSQAAVLTAAAAGVHLALLALLYYSACYLSHRHLMPLVGLLFPWIGAGTVILAGMLQRRFLPASGDEADKRTIRLTILAVAVMVIAMLPQSLRPLHAQAVPLIEMAQRIRGQASAGARVLSNSAYVPFYSGLPGRLLEASEGLPELARSGDRPPYRFVVLEVGSSNFNPQWLPQLAAIYKEVETRPLDGGKRSLVLMTPR